MKRLLAALSVSLLVIIFLFSRNVPEGPLVGLSILTVIGLLWMTEALHLTVTALLVPVLAISLGILGVKPALVSFAHPLIFLFLAGFALASALKKNGIDRALANWALKVSHDSFFVTTLLLFAVTAVLSMMISNTATAAMMLPLALGMLVNADKEKDQGTFVYVLLGVAYSASIGGMGTLVGSPPNALAAASVGIDFVGWLEYGIPTVFVLMPIMVIILYFVTKPNLTLNAASSGDLTFVWNRERKLTLAIFIAAVILWIGSRKFGQMIGVDDDFDTLVGLLVIVALTITRAVEWKDVQNSTDWGVLLLFGGGIALSKVLTSTGAGQYLGEQIRFTADLVGPTLLIVLLLAFVVFLTELVSNTAMAALLVPIFVPLAASINLPAVSVALVIGLGASCAFMLPVATPPNALVYGTGYIPQQKMMKIGFQLNLAAIAVLSLMATLFY